MFFARHKKFILYHFAAAVAIVLIARFYKCPFYYIFNFPCAGCGITRAYKSLLALDIKQAFRYHPLFWIVAPVLLYLVHENILPKRFSPKTETVILYSVCAAFLLVYVIRLITGDLLVLV